MDKQEIAQEFKVVLLGNAAVGKTSIINRMIKNTFNENNPSTVGAMFMTYLAEVDGRTYKLQIWDTAGQERLRSIAPIYYRDAHGVFLVYDTTSMDSIAGLESWHKDVVDKGSERISMVVMGNKIDLFENQEVSKEKAKQVAASFRSELCLVSAKDGTGIEEAVNSLVKRILYDQSNGPSPSPVNPSSKIDRKTFYKPPSKPENAKGGCCK